MVFQPTVPISAFGLAFQEHLDQWHLCVCCSELWKNPSSFDPDRFLSADGTEVNKLLGEKVMIFGMGKRRCIGEVIARNEVYLFLAILLQKLEFLPMPGETMDLTPEYGLTMRPKHFRLKAGMRTRNEQ